MGHIFIPIAVGFYKSPKGVVSSVQSSCSVVSDSL